MKNKFLIYMSVFLSLGLLAVSSLSAVAKEETSRTVAKVPIAQVHTTSVPINPWAVSDGLRLIEAQNAANWYKYWSEHPVKVATKSGQSPKAVYGSGACGGDLPSCSVMMCENGGKITGRNPRNPRVSGKWQIDDDTWAGYGGYASAEDAPESVQDERARQIYNGGKGRGQWAC